MLKTTQAAGTNVTRPKTVKEQLDKRPAWNNDWHKDDVEVLVNDQHMRL